MNIFNATDLQQRLRDIDILPTLQRMAVACVMPARAAHMTARQVLDAGRRQLPRLSRATVYSVLQLFARRGLLKELPVEGTAVVYDPNTSPHRHLHDVDTGEVPDLADDKLHVLGLPDAIGGMQLAGVDVIIRVRGLHHWTKRRSTPGCSRPFRIGSTQPALAESAGASACPSSLGSRYSLGRWCAMPLWQSMQVLPDLAPLTCFL